MEELVSTVSVDVAPIPGRGTTAAGENLAVAPAGNPEALSPTA
jgi:hypothetical protein